MRMVVVLPEPFGPRKPTISPSRDFEIDVVDDGLVAEALGQAVHVDDRCAGGVHCAAPSDGVDVDRLAERQARRLAGQHRLGAEHQLVAVVAAEDDRRGELGLACRGS